MSGDTACTVRLIQPPSVIRPQCEAILRDLPDWFGIEESLVEYAEAAQEQPTLLAESADGETVGFLSMRRHFKHAAEIHCIAVLRRAHRRGIGATLVQAAVDWLSKQAVEYLQVKTLGPSRACEHYDRTRRFYLALGFRELEEFKTLWDERNPCLLLVRSITRR